MRPEHVETECATQLVASPAAPQTPPALSRGRLHDGPGTWGYAALTVLLTAVLTGCVPAPRHPLFMPHTHAPHVRPAHAQFVPGHWPKTHWWKAFHDASLNRLITMGLQASGTIKAALARARAAQAAIGITGGAIGPALAADGTIDRQRASATGLIPPPFAGHTVNYASVGVTGHYDLSWWDKQHAALRTAIGKARAAWATSAETRLLVSTHIARTYFALAKAADDLHVARAGVTVRTHLADLIRVRYHAGIVSAMRYQAAANALARAERAEAAAELAFTRLRLALTALVGRGPRYASHIHVPRVLPVRRFRAPAHLPLELLARRPDLRARYWEVRAASAGIAVAKAGYYPNISLNADLAFQSISLASLMTPSNITAAIGPAIHLPLFDSGARRARLTAARARYDAAVALYNKTILDASGQVARALAAIRFARRQEHDAQRALRHARTGYRLAMARFRAGIYGPIPARTSRLAVLQGVRGLAAARTRVLLADLSLIQALGGGYHERS